ncbi:MAG: RNA polymerase sigma factor [Tannerellaceae bacterium]|nr:RNA polymerase sigma factor [Tannerellaceae bacterium]
MNDSQFQRLLWSLKDNMMNFAFKLTANREDAKDLTQETFLKALTYKDKFVDNKNFKGWVFTVMRNTFINDYHKVVRGQTVIDTEADMYKLENVSDISNLSPEHDIHVNEVTHLIKGMKEDYQICFSLYLTGYKYHEIAEKMNIPIGTVKSNIHTARTYLKTRLERNT